MRQWTVVLGLIASGCVRGPQVRASGFVVATTQDVELRTDVDAGRAARIARSLQEIHDTFAEHLFPCAREVVTPPVRVTALSHESDVVGFYRVSDTSWGESQLVVLARGDETTTEIFAHELAHRFIAICYPRAPVWMNEGLATAFQTVQPADDERMIVGLAPFAFGDRFDLTSTGFVWVTTVPTPLVPTVAELTAMDPAEFHAHGVRARYADLRRTMHYAAAWALVHMLGLGPDDALRSEFDRWLVRIGTSPDATARARAARRRWPPATSSRRCARSRWRSRCSPTTEICAKPSRDGSRRRARASTPRSSS